MTALISYIQTNFCISRFIITLKFKMAHHTFLSIKVAYSYSM